MKTNRLPKLPGLQWLMLSGVSALCATSAWAAPETDAGWPRVSTTSDGNRVEVFQPQLESWKTNHLVARAVVEVTIAGDLNPHLGVAWFSGDTVVNTAQRLVTMTNASVSRVQFSDAAEQEANMLAVVSNALPKTARTIALDRLTAMSVVAQSRAKRAAITLKHDAPLVIWTTNAVAALVLIDGDPVLRPVTNSPLMRVINTAALILFDPNGGTYYLSGDGGLWFQSNGINGPWSVTANPPSTVSALTPPGSGTNSTANAGAQSPVVFVSTKPAELLNTAGAPNYQSEIGSGLLYAANTDSQLIYNPMGGTVYLLLSGRWFSSTSLSGPWTYVAPKDLPSIFSQIAPDGPKAAVLSSVPGTPQAAAARAANSLPQTTTIQRSGASFEVQYDGPPQFKPIDGTSLTYAVNASAAVILCENQYYGIGNAVWFVSASPTGPWEVATSVPDEIYTIPSSSPLYYVTYAYVGYADTNQVEAAYLPGYTGSYDDYDANGEYVGPVYGTGWYYPPWTGDYYYGWGYPYGYGYQYRWWQNNWLWRPPWNRVGNLYAVNAGSLYNRAGSAPSAARAAGAGYPSMYGRFAGATRAVPMQMPARAELVNPYATAPLATARAATGRGAEQLTRSVRVGSAEARDLYATGSGQVYRRQDGKWYSAQSGGKWAYVAPAVGPRTSAYNPQTIANYDRPAAYQSAAAAASTAAAATAAAANYRRQDATPALDQDYNARAAGERAVQQAPRAPTPAYRAPARSFRGGGGRR